MRSSVWRRTVAVGLACAGTLLAACKPGPEIEERLLFVYSPRACPVAQSEAFSVVYGNGDFEPGENQAVTSLFLRDVGTELTALPPKTRSLIVDIAQPQQGIDWRGLAEVPRSGPINVLVWPDGETCRLTRNVESRTDPALAAFGRHVMIAGGKIPGRVPNTFVGDLSTGILESLEFGLGTRRSHPTITAFRESADQDPAPALVAGGDDPDSQIALATAEIYVPKAGAPGDLGDFERTRIDLSEPRTKHGAVVLASGETLLVGGVGQSGTELSSMEIVDPKTRRYRTNNVALLSVPRANPVVLRLASGEILVAGGTSRNNRPVPTLEWFSADASRPTRRPIDLVTGRERAFVPLAAGGALAVIAPSTSAPDFKTVWIISADGTLEPGIPIDPELLDVVRLYPGTDGAPVLWTGRRWLRWEPWFSTFQPLPDAPTGEDAGPRSSAIASGDNGLALWLDDRGEAGMYVRGFRFATRSRFGTVRNPLLVQSTEGLAPDRVAGVPGSSIRFVPGRGLELGPGASAFLTDVTFADVNVDLDVVGAAPSVVLRQEDGRELEVGGAACAFAQSATRSLHVERAARRVRVRIDGGDLRTCPTELDEGARVAVGLRGGGGTAAGVATNLRVLRR